MTSLDSQRTRSNRGHRTRWNPDEFEYSQPEHRYPPAELTCSNTPLWSIRGLEGAAAQVVEPPWGSDHDPDLGKRPVGDTGFEPVASAV